jgi:hypothetical protein
MPARTRTEAIRHGDLCAARRQPSDLLR